MREIKQTVKAFARFIRSVFKTLYSFLLIIKHRSFPLNLSRLSLKKDEDVFILATGPSLSGQLENYIDELKTKEIFALNEFCLNENFERIKPKYYLLADPAYLQRKNVSAAFSELQEKMLSAFLQKVTWELTIFIPKNSENRPDWERLVEKNGYVKIQCININRIESFIPIMYYFFQKNMGMPLLQNVLIGAIFLSLNMGYKNIYLLGADHSLHEGLMVDGDSNLCIQTKHFDQVGERRLYYKDYTETEIFKIHEFFLAWSRTFEGYHILKKYADSLHACILNMTEQSYIDAFPKMNIKNVLKK